MGVLPPVDDQAPVAEEAAQHAVHAPMTGTVLALSAVPGQLVAQGAELAVLESMKMEHVVPAPVSGTLTGWRVEPGEVVDEGAVLEPSHPPMGVKDAEKEHVAPGARDCPLQLSDASANGKMKI